MTTPKKPAPAPIKREDRPGHLDPKHAASLHAMSEASRDHDDERAFVGGGREKDDLAEELAEEAVVAMTSGEDNLGDDIDASTDDERGGPFVPSTAGKEFASGTDASNPKTATKAAFPKT